MFWYPWSRRMRDQFPPVEPFLRQTQGEPQVQAALWTAWLLTHRKDVDQTYAHRLPSGATITIPQIAERLLMVAGEADKPPLETMYARYKNNSFYPRMTLNIISWANLRLGDTGFPWEPVIVPIIGAIQPLPIDDTTIKTKFNLTWREREEFRLAFGVYMAPPWALPSIPDHYPHISIEESTTIAYTQDPDKGERDIQTRIKPGRYLKKFYPDLGPEDINRVQAQVSGLKIGVSFASKAEDIERVFRRGPQSCMSYPRNQYGLSAHPTAAYADSDLQIAYLMEKDGTVTARTPVWPEKKIYLSQIYGDSYKLAAQLNAMGYTAGNTFCFHGARIRKIRDDNTRNKLIVPAIDYNRQFEVVDDDWLKVSKNGFLDYGTGAAGCVTIQEPVACNKCGALIQSKALKAVTGMGDICPACLKAADLVKCDGGGGYYPSHKMREVQWGGGRRYQFGPRALEERCFYCHGSKKWYGRDNYRAVEMADGKKWEREFFRAHGVARDGKYYPKDAEAA